MVDEATETVFLGHITGVSGLKGWVKVHSDTSPRENIVSYKAWWIEQAGHWREINVLEGRPQGKTIVAKLEGVSTPEEAAVLIKARIAVKRSDMPELSAHEYYWADLVGMQVVTVDDVVVGPIDRMFETGANDVAVVTDTRATDDGERSKVSEVLVPWLVPDVIKDVDLKNRTITVDWDPDF